jgi:hypothetical protein
LFFEAVHFPGDEIDKRGIVIRSNPQFMLHISFSFC